MELSSNQETELTRVEVNLGKDEEAATLASPKLQDDVVDWEGPDDPNNPLNWPATKSFGHVVIVAILSMVV